MQSQYEEELSAESGQQAHVPATAGYHTEEAMMGYNQPDMEMAGHVPSPTEIAGMQQNYSQPPLPQDLPPVAPSTMSDFADPRNAPAGGQPGQYGQYVHDEASGSQMPAMPVPSIAREASQGGGVLKKMMFGGAFVTALAVGGGLAYTYKYTDLLGSSASSGPAPTVKAGSSSIRIARPKQVDANKNSNKAVHERLSASRDEKAGTAALSGGDRLAKKSNETGLLAGNRVAAASSGMLPERGSANAGNTASGNAPRRVKTLIVRPDGTILQPAGNDKAATVSANATSLAVAPGINAAAVAKSTNRPVKTDNRIRRMKTIGEASTARRMGETANGKEKKVLVKKATVKTAATSSSPVRKIRAMKPLANSGATTSPAPSGRPAVAPTRTAGEVGTPFVVQVTSRSSQTRALAAFADMQQKYPSLIGSYGPDIQRADLGAKGVWYRLRVGPVDSKLAATNLCSSLKRAGHPGCFVRRK